MSEEFDVAAAYEASVSDPAYPAGLTNEQVYAVLQEAVSRSFHDSQAMAVHEVCEYYLEHPDELEA